MRSFDVIAIGDSSMDSMLLIDDAHVQCSIDKQACQFCVNYADKIAVERFAQAPGGNAANHAVGIARLGLRSALCSHVGNDHAGHRIRAHLRDERVDCSLVQTQRFASNASTAIIFQGERTLFTFHQHWKYLLPRMPKARWVFYTSTGKHFARLHAPLLAYLRKSGARLAFSPGTYHLRDVANIRNILARTSVLFVNREEACTLLNVQHETPMRILLEELRGMGPEIVVVTDGPQGSACFDGEHFAQLGVFNVPILERTGAGDALASGFIAALCNGKNARDALAWGTLNSAGVVQKMGAQEGLLRTNELKRLLAGKPSFSKARFW